MGASGYTLRAPESLLFLFIFLAFSGQQWFVYPHGDGYLPIFFIPLKKNAGSANPGNHRANDMEVMGKQWEGGPRHWAGPRRTLVHCSAMETKEEGDGVCGW